MESNWKVVQLGELYGFTSGLSKPRSDFGFGHGFLSFKDVFYNYFVPTALDQLVNSSEREQQTCSIKRGDVFLTRTSETIDELGMSCVALKDYERATFNGFTKRLRPKDPARVVPEYVGYYLRSRTFRNSITAMSSLSTRASLNNDMLSRLTILLPPVETQRAIGLVLKSLDDKIELNQQMNVTLNAMTKALFQSWFVDFDPVRAHLDGTPVAGIDLATSRQFPKEFKDSLLGRVPASWSVMAFSEVLVPHTERVGESRVAEFSATVSGLALRDERFNKQLSKSQSKNKRIVKGDLVFGLSREVINFGLMRDPAGAVSPVYDVFKIDSSKIEPELLERSFRFNMPYYMDILKPGAREGKPIDRQYLLKKHLLVPDIAIQRAFLSAIQPWIDKIAANNAQSSTLAKIRDSLLPRLISGELNVARVPMGTCM